MLGTLITFILIHFLNESKHWASSLKLFTQLSQDLPGGSQMEMPISLGTPC